MTTNTALTIARPAPAEVPAARRRPNPRPAPRPSVAPSRSAPAERPARGTRLRRRLLVGAVTVTLAGGALALGFQVGHAGAELEGPPPADPVYVVQPGDTLWAIAARLAPEVEAQRAVAALVRSAGGASLTPGQRIVVPAALR